MTAPFRGALDGLVPYEPGRPVEIVQRELGLAGPIVKLASNEGPWGPVPAALEAIVKAASAGNRYPDGGCWALRTALAERHGLAFEQVVVGNGADGVLNYLALAMLEPGDEVAFGWPSFPVYPINAAKMGAVAVRAPLSGSSYDLEALADCVNERTKLVYVTNPNNPTGGLVKRAALERFLDGLPATVLPVLDEAYFEYVDDPEYPDGASEQLRARKALRRPAHVLEDLRPGGFSRRLRALPARHRGRLPEGQERVRRDAVGAGRRARQSRRGRRGGAQAQGDARGSRAPGRGAA